MITQDTKRSVQFSLSPGITKVSLFYQLSRDKPHVYVQDIVAFHKPLLLVSHVGHFWHAKIGDGCTSPSAEAAWTSFVSSQFELQNFTIKVAPQSRARSLRFQLAPGLQNASLFYQLSSEMPHVYFRDISEKQVLDVNTFVSHIWHAKVGQRSNLSDTIPSWSMTVSAVPQVRQTHTIHLQQRVRASFVLSSNVTRCKTVSTDGCLLQWHEKAFGELKPGQRLRVNTFAGQTWSVWGSGKNGTTKLWEAKLKDCPYQTFVVVV